MRTKLKTAPTAYPLGLKEVKQHLNITIGWTEDDNYLDALIAVATAKAEQWTKRRFITQSWYMYLDEWPDTDYIVLPFGQLQSVTSVYYTDSSNTQRTTFTDASLTTTDDYDVDTDQDPGRIVLEYGDSWPTDSLWPMNPIEIDFTCGYGGSGSDVPHMIRHAMKLIISDLYETRETETFGVSVQKLKTIENLLMPYRIWV